MRDFPIRMMSLVLGMMLINLPLAAQTTAIADDENSATSESLENDGVVAPVFPTPDNRGDYQPATSIHRTWEIVDRGLSGLNCYETFPPNPGSHLVVSRLFSGQILEVTAADEGEEVWVESRGKTWLSVKDPWSGQACWVRAHDDFIKPIEENLGSIEKSLGFSDVLRSLTRIIKS